MHHLFFIPLDTFYMYVLWLGEKKGLQGTFLAIHFVQVSFQVDELSWDKRCTMSTVSLWITLKKSVLLATRSMFFSASSLLILVKCWK